MAPKVVVVMGSRSDLKVMRGATDILEQWGVNVETQILSAHRTPVLLEKSVKQWESKNVQVIIAGAGGAAHLPGMLASYSVIPVVGVPIASQSMGGLDALLSVAQMPKGVPVATVAVGNAVNAGLLAIEILALSESPFGQKMRLRLKKYKSTMAVKVKSDRKKLSRMTVSQFLKTTKK